MASTRTLVAICVVLLAINIMWAIILSQLDPVPVAFAKPFPGVGQDDGLHEIGRRAC